MVSVRTCALALALFALHGCGSETPDDALGSACATDRDCGDLVCRADLDQKPNDLAALPLVCGAADERAEPGSACERDEDCANGICLLAGACASPCSDAGGCTLGERCQTVFARRGTGALQTLSACVTRVNLPSDATVVAETRAHAIAVGDNSIALEAPPSGQALYVLEHARDAWPDGTRCRTPLCMRSLYEERTQRLLFDADADYLDDSPILPVAIGDLINPLVIAHYGDAARFGYVANVSAEQAGDLRITQLARSASGHQLDLNVFYLDALDWKPTGDRGPELLADALDVVDEILGQADITIGDVRQIAVPGELPTRGVAFPNGDAAQGFSVLDVRFGVYVELPSLFRLSAGANNNAINLFFLQDIVPRDGDGEPEAQAGGIPGPLGMHGTAGSGIAIATDMMDGEPARLGRTLAHEIAHYLGLFHTSEGDGRVFDPLDDTPECRADRDTDGDGLSATDCEDAGADNLMFWALATGTKLTEEQRAVLRAALVLR